MNPGLHGKRGLILGIANEHSIAYGFARLARQQGARLVGSCVNERAYAAVVGLTQALDMPLQVCNVESDSQLESAVLGAVDALGGLDFVVHSIAWAPTVDLHAPVMETSAAGFARAMALSCHSFARLARICAPHMAGGSMVTMSYLGASRAVPHYGLMGPVKAALEALVRYLARELGPSGLRVHAVSPGPIPTRAASGIDHFDDLLDDARRRAPLGRLGSLDEIAHLTAFLCSDASAGMTGQTIYVDAGYHAIA